MRADLLHVIAVRENPRRFATPDRLYLDFEQHMLDSGVRLTVVECAFGERPFVLEDRPHINHVGVRARTMLWHKECLINLGVRHLPRDWRYMAWIDSDIRFRRPHWAAETVHGLQHYGLLQPWDTCYDLGPTTRTWTSTARSAGSTAPAARSFKARAAAAMPATSSPIPATPGP